MSKQPATEESRFGRDLTTGSIPRHLVAFALPMLAGNLLHTAYSIVNAIWVGKGLGKMELAAVTVSFPVVFVLVSLAGGLTMASGILVAQFAGARNYPRLREVVNTSTALIGLISLLLLPIGELLTPWILRAMRTGPDVYPLAVGYMRIFLLTIPSNFGIFLVMSALRGVGDSKTPLYFQAAGLALTAVLDPILMFGWLGAPRLGLNGTAVAAAAMQALSLVALYAYLYRKEHVVAPDWSRLRIERETAGLILKLGFPSALQQSFISLGMLVVTGFINSFGEDATAAFGAAMRIDQVAFIPAMTLGAAVSTLVGQNIGAQRLDRVPQVFGWGMLIAGGITVLVSVVAVMAPRLLLGMFVTDAEVMRIGIAYLRIMGSFYIFLAVIFVGNGVLNGAGHTVVTTGIALIALWGVRVPLAAYLSHRMHRVEGVFWAMVLSSAASSAICLACYFSGLWKRPVVRHHLAAPAPAEPEPDAAPVEG